MTADATPNHDPDTADVLLVEVKIVPLFGSDADRRGRQLRAIIVLPRGQNIGRDHRELPSPLRSDLVSGNCDVPCSRGRSGQRCPDRVGSLGRTSAADQAPHRASGTNEAEVEPCGERWITKQQLAERLAVTPRWIEYQQRRGLPRLRMGGMNRYRVSEVEAWLRGSDAAFDAGEDR